jgi:hypothetical protein
MALAIPENIREFLRVMGAHGGRARARKYSKEKLAEWGKLGGRPRKPTLAPPRPAITATELE